jgi:hypothetical protein
MLIALRSFIQLPRIGRFVLVPVFAAVSVFALNAAGQQTPPAQATGAAAAPASQAPANVAGHAPCHPNANIDIPLSSTIETKVTGLMDSGHLKVGKEFWVNVIYGQVYPGCRLNAGAAIYGHVTSAVSQKDPSSSELSLVFDHADCEGHGKKEMPMRLIALMRSSDESTRLHDEVPLEMKGAARNITSAKAAFNGTDILNPGGPARTVRPGIVIGLPKMKLEVEGGPGCSARISSTDRSVQLGLGAELILVVQSAP